MPDVVVSAVNAEECTRLRAGRSCTAIDSALLLSGAEAAPSRALLLTPAALAEHRFRPCKSIPEARGR